MKKDRYKRKIRFTVLLTPLELDLLKALVESMDKDNPSQVIRQLIKDKVDHPNIVRVEGCDIPEKEKE